MLSQEPTEAKASRHTHARDGIASEASTITLSHASGNVHSNQAFCKRSWRGWLKLLLHDLPEDSFRCSGLDTVRNSVVASQRLAAAHCTCRAGTGPAKLRTNCCCCCLSDGLNSRGLRRQQTGTAGGNVDGLYKFCNRSHEASTGECQLMCHVQQNPHV